MPHDRPSLRCTLSGWCAQPRWREQMPWTVREPRRRPGRRTIQILRIHSQAALVSGGVVQCQQHNNSQCPMYTNLRKKVRNQNVAAQQHRSKCLKSVTIQWHVNVHKLQFQSLRRQENPKNWLTHLQGDGGCPWQWWDTGCGRYRHKVQSEPRSTSNPS